jgi:hypothetical protein
MVKGRPQFKTVNRELIDNRAITSKKEPRSALDTYNYNQALKKKYKSKLIDVPGRKHKKRIWIPIDDSSKNKKSEEINNMARTKQPNKSSALEKEQKVKKYL